MVLNIWAMKGIILISLTLVQFRLLELKIKLTNMKLKNLENHEQKLKVFLFLLSSAG